METIKIKCPHCSAILQTKKFAGIESKNIKCPVCKTMTKFTDYKVPNQHAQQATDDDTIIPGKSNNNDITELNGGKQTIIGKLQDPATQTRYTLQMGVNVIGRKAHSSSANVQIETDDSKMSRAHSVIEVLKLKNGEIVHHFSNAKNKNATYINARLIEDEDRIVLHGGEVIKMANTVLKFMVHATDETTF